MKVGRITVAVTFIAVGFAFLIDQWTESRFFVTMLLWWPVVLILFGLEILLFYRRRGRKIDLGGLLLLILVVIVMAAIVGGQELGVSVSFKDGLNFSINNVDGESYPLEPLSFSAQNRERLAIENINGRIEVTPYDGDEIVVQPVLSVPKHNKNKREKIKKDLHFNVIEGHQEISVAVDWKGGVRILDLFQNFHAVDLEVKVPSTLSVRLETANGAIAVRDLGGNVTAEVANGKMTITNIDGDVNVEAANGTVKIVGVKGSVKAETANGSIDIRDVSGDVTAETVAGRIVFRSAQITGNWRAETTAGSIQAMLPETADVQLSVSTDMGKVKSDYDLSGNGNERTSATGRGTYDVRLVTTVGQIRIDRLSAE